MCVSLCIIVIGTYVHRIYNSFVKKHEIILHITSCLLSEHTLRNISIVIMKKFDFEILTISTCSESRMESLHIFRLSFYIRQKVNKRCSRKHLHSIVATTKKQNIRLKQLHKERKIVISSMAYGEKVAGQITKNKTEYYLLEGKCVGLQSVTEKLEQKFALESRLWLYNFF